MYYSGSRTKRKYRFLRETESLIINETNVAFQYINTKHNLADIPTRAMSVNDLKITSCGGIGLNGSCKIQTSGHNGTQE